MRKSRNWKEKLFSTDREQEVSWRDFRKVAARFVAASAARASDLTPDETSQLSEDRALLAENFEDIAASIWKELNKDFFPLEDDHVFVALSREAFLDLLFEELPTLMPRPAPAIVKPSTLTAHIRNMDPARCRADYLAAMLTPTMDAWERQVEWAESKTAAFCPSSSQHQAKSLVSIHAPAEIMMRFNTLQKAVTAIKSVQEAQRKSYELASRLFSTQTAVPTAGKAHEETPIDTEGVSAGKSDTDSTKNESVAARLRARLRKQ